MVKKYSFKKISFTTKTHIERPPHSVNWRTTALYVTLTLLSNTLVARDGKLFLNLFIDSVQSFYSVVLPRLKSSTSLHTPDLKANLPKINLSPQIIFQRFHISMKHFRFYAKIFMYRIGYLLCKDHNIKN